MAKYKLHISRCSCYAHRSSSVKGTLNKIRIFLRYFFFTWTLSWWRRNLSPLLTFDRFHAENRSNMSIVREFRLELNQLEVLLWKVIEWRPEDIASDRCALVFDSILLALLPCIISRYWIFVSHNRGTLLWHWAGSFIPSGIDISNVQKPLQSKILLKAHFYSIKIQWIGYRSKNTLKATFYVKIHSLWRVIWKLKVNE